MHRMPPPEEGADEQANAPAEAAQASTAQPLSLLGNTTFTRVLPQTATLGGNLYFVADDGLRGLELWRSNGTASGTAMVQDLTPGSGGSFNASQALQIAATSEWLYVISNGKLYRTKGTSGLTQINTSSYAPTTLAATSSTLFAHHNSNTAATHRLYRVENNSTQYQSVRAINRIDELTAVGSRVYFSASEAGNDFELWRSDGTTNGTTRVADAIPGTSTGVGPKNVTAVGNRLYFTATTATRGHELYRADGQTVSLVKDLTPGSESSRISHLTTFGNQLAFYLGDSEGRGIASQEKSVWVTNGTANGTKRFHSETQGSLTNGAVTHDTPFLVADGRLHFLTVGDYSRGMFVYGDGYRLWRSQATEASTFQVAARSKVRKPLFAGAVGKRIIFIAPASANAGTKGTAQFYDATTQPATIKRQKAPRIRGTLVEGKTVKADPGKWSRGSVSYRWLRNGKQISTPRSIALRSGDTKKKLVLEVRVRSVGAPDVVYRTKAKVVLKKISKMSGPSVKGKARVGNKLTVRPPKLSPKPSKIRYQWYANGKKLKGENKRSLTLKAKHRGKKISVRATATKKHYLALTTKSSSKRMR